MVIPITLLLTDSGSVESVAQSSSGTAPLNQLFKWFGAYFIRRRYREPL